MRVLVACEESQRVCTAFRERGHEEYTDSDPVEVDHIDTGIGFRIVPDEEEDA